MRFPTNVRSRLAAVFTALTVLAVAGSVHAQFAAPTCTPPNCNPEVIQNIDVAGASQNASINVSGSAKFVSSLTAGDATSPPTLTLASQNLIYGNVSGASTNASLMLLQFGALDRLRVSLAGQLQLPLGTGSAPSYSFLGDTNTGIYSPAPDVVNIQTDGSTRVQVNNTGLVLNNGILTASSGTAGLPGINFLGDTNTGIYRSAADTIGLVTNGVSRLAIDSTGAVTIPGNLTVNGTFTSSGGFGGDGSNITNLNASNIATGTLNDARLSANVALLDRANQNFTGNNTFAGNVGVGTTTPGDKLDVVGNIGVGGATVGVPGGTSGQGIAFPSTNNDYIHLFGEHNGADTSNGIFWTADNADDGWYFRNSDCCGGGTVDYMRVAKSVAWYQGGNFGIGTSSPGTMLAVAGMTSLGSASLVVGAGQNLLYGNMDTTSTGNLLLLQNESVDRFRVDAAGNLTLAGTITAAGTLTSGGQNVCVQDGTNCPPTLNGAGTANYLTKFTGTGDTVGNSIIQDDGSTVGIGGAPDASYSARVYGSLRADAISAQGVSVYTTGSNAISGQAVGVGSSGVVGSGSSYGVYGTAGSGTGVYGTSTGTGRGLYGYNSGTGYGVLGESVGGWGGSFNSLYVAGQALLAGGLTLGGAGGLTLASSGADISGANGAMFYNSTTNKFRCYENGAWKNCTDGAVSSVTGSGAGISVSPTTGAVVVSNTGDTNAADDFTGSGTANTIPKFTGALSLGNSIITDNGATATIGGALAVTGNITTAGVSVCRQNGTNCPPVVETDTLATVTGRGATTATAISVNAAGTAISGTGSGAGVYGTAGSNGGIGVYGSMTAASGYGVYGTSSGSGGNGVYGNAGASNGIGVNGLGGYAGVAGTGPYGGYFDGGSSGSYAAGVHGSGYHGVEGVAENNGYGVVGSGGQYGVLGNGSYIGLYGQGGTYGVYATGSSYAIYAGGNSYTTGSHTVGGDFSAEWNSWGGDMGWAGACGAGTNGGYCTCPNGSYVMEIYHSNPDDSWWRTQVHCRRL